MSEWLCGRHGTQTEGITKTIPEIMGEQKIQSCHFHLYLNVPKDIYEVSYIAGRFFTIWATREAQRYIWEICMSVQLCLILCDPMDCRMQGFPVHHQLPELAQTHVHRISDAIQPSHPLSSPFPPVFNLSQDQGLFQWVSSLHQVAKVLELQHQSFQWIFRTDLH